MVPFKSHNAESHLHDDSIAFIRTHIREFLVERCEALMSAGNLKIDGRTISITGDRGKEKSRVGLCNQGPVCHHSCLRCTIKLRKATFGNYYDLEATPREPRVRGEDSDRLSKVTHDFLSIVDPDNILVAPYTYQ
uniref:S4 RNA-binding domain-containing protein n=1 Tax=Rhabditophanes sp. KR3021 TaxID=114890 RepID=A0AC35UEI6_9BILA